MAPKRGRILIVDDKPANAILLTRILQDIAHIQVVHNGTDALALLDAERFDLVLLDLMMPGIDGFDVLDHVRTCYRADELPVIIVSALLEDEHITRGLRAGANDYVTKPFRPHIIKLRVETQLNLKLLADERQALVQQLEHANRIRNNLLRVASHDLKTPLHSINMAMQVIEETDGLPENIRDVVQIGKNGVASMLDTIGAFLDLDVLRDERIVVHPERINVAQAVSEVLLAQQDVASQKGIRFQLSLIEVDVMADARYLAHALSNIVSNAIKYSPLGADVAIDVERFDDAVFVHVVDQGCGIPEAELPLLFKPFAKISTRPTANEPSTGIGLWIAQEMMHLQGGEIGLNCPPEGGCDFWIRLPRLSLPATDPEALAGMAV